MFSASWMHTIPQHYIYICNVLQTFHTIHSLKCHTHVPVCVWSNYIAVKGDPCCFETSERSLHIAFTLAWHSMTSWMSHCPVVSLCSNPVQACTLYDLCNPLLSLSNSAAPQKCSSEFKAGEVQSHVDKDAMWCVPFLMSCDKITQVFSKHLAAFFFFVSAFGSLDPLLTSSVLLVMLPAAWQGFAWRASDLCAVCVMTFGVCRVPACGKCLCFCACISCVMQSLPLCT